MFEQWAAGVAAARERGIQLGSAAERFDGPLVRDLQAAKGRPSDTPWGTSSRGQTFRSSAGPVSRSVHLAQVAAVATTCGFTKQARIYETGPDLRRPSRDCLVDHDALGRWAGRTGFPP